MALARLESYATWLSSWASPECSSFDGCSTWSTCLGDAALIPSLYLETIFYILNSYAAWLTMLYNFLF